MSNSFDTLLLKAKNSFDDLENLFVHCANIISQGDWSPATKRKNEVVECFKNWRKEYPIAQHFENVIEGISAFIKSDKEEALKLFRKSTPPEFNWPVRDYEGVVQGFEALVHRGNGHYDKSLFCLQEAIKKISFKGRMAKMLATSYYQLGEIYRSLNDYNQAIEYFEEALNNLTVEDVNLFRIYSGLGTTYMEQEKYDIAKKHLDLALEHCRPGSQEGRALCDLAEYYLCVRELKKALEFCHKSYEIRIQNNLLDAASTCLILEGKILFKENKIEECVETLHKALELAKEYNVPVKMKEIHRLLARAHENKKEFEKAFFHLDTFERIQAELLIRQSQEVYKVKNAEVAAQKTLVEQAHQEITDSINYAERIQRSFLATEETLNAHLKDYFVYFNPKEAVSGDFYWAGELENGNFAIACADSTGHGVPGAIMSILNVSSIEKAVELGCIKAAQIFNEARKTIIERLKKDGSEEGGKDGMDASLLILNPENSVLEYVAANNPIWILRSGEIIDLWAEKMPVGKHDNDHTPFKGGEFELEKGDVVYAMTDGYQDQFGGEKGKKFKVKPLKRMLLEIAHLPMREQKEVLSKTFDSWKGNLEQVDDVCLIGLRI